jgi:hypothetical protein
LGVPLEVLLDITPMTSGEALGEAAEAPAPALPPVALGRVPSADRAEELMEKFRVLLASPLAEGVARIVEESFRLLPIIPPPTAGDPSSYVPAREIEPARRSRPRSQSTA